MLQFVVLVKQSTLRAISEHSTACTISGVLTLNESESLIMLDRDVVEAILRNARPGDQRIDDVIGRMVL